MPERKPLVVDPDMYTFLESGDQARSNDPTFKSIRENFDELCRIYHDKMRDGVFIGVNIEVSTLSSVRV